MHHDHIPEVPAGCLLLGSSPVCYNQGFVRYLPGREGGTALRDIQIFTVQGHPEFTREIVGTIVDVREARGVFPKALADGARARADWRNDGVEVIARVIWNILGVSAES